jgi:hypothetical protein
VSNAAALANAVDWIGLESTLLQYMYPHRPSLIAVFVGGVGCHAGETAQTALGDVAVLQVRALCAITSWLASYVEDA